MSQGICHREVLLHQDLDQVHLVGQSCLPQSLVVGEHIVIGLELDLMRQQSELLAHPLFDLLGHISHIVGRVNF